MRRIELCQGTVSPSWVWAACLSAAIGLGFSTAACENDTPEESSAAAGGGGGSTGDAAAEPCADDDIVVRDDASCQALESDYDPADSANDTWASCVSDDNQYHPFDSNISSIARVGAFEQIAQLLGFGTGVAPTAQNFVDARLAYQTDQGLESRLSRREDEHYPKAPAACNTLSEAELASYADRCVGPAKIQPLLNEAFAQGIAGIEPAKNAARIEAGLLWFLYVSVYKEATTCAKTVADCDSSWAYYTGGEPRSGGLGLARYTRQRSPQAHDRAWDGLLAVRCWRDLDNPTGEAQDAALQQKALAQLDRALLRGLALIVRQRAEKASCEAAWESVRILGPVLQREAALRDASAAQVLATEVARTNGADADIGALTSAIDTLFPCP